MTLDLITWSGELSVGVAEIDEQHRHLVLLLNELHRAIHDHRGSEVSRDVLRELAEYVRVHFATEESLMRVSGYPGFAAHKEAHEKLVAQVVALQEKVDGGQAKISFELIHFLKNWLVQHILGTDQEFGAYFTKSAEAAKWSAAPVPASETRRPWWKFW